MPKYIPDNLSHRPTNSYLALMARTCSRQTLSLFYTFSNFFFLSYLWCFLFVSSLFSLVVQFRVRAGFDIFPSLFDSFTRALEVRGDVWSKRGGVSTLTPTWIVGF